MESTTPSAQEQAAPRDALLHVADLHFWEVVRNPFQLLNKRFLGNLNVALRRRHEFAMDRAAQYADQLAATGIRSVLFTGDFTSTSTEREFALAARFVEDLAQRGMTVLVTPGNHDVYTFEARRRGRFERHFAEYLPEEGYPARRTLPGGTSVVLAPTVRPNLVSSRGSISPAEVRAVSALLQDASDPVIVAGHYPVLHRTAQYDAPPGRRLLNAETLREALGACGKRVLYVCGHVHRFSLTPDPEHPNVTHLSTGALFRRDRAGSCTGEFSEIQVSGDEARVFRHVREQEWRRRRP